MDVTFEMWASSREGDFTAAQQKKKKKKII